MIADHTFLSPKIKIHFAIDSSVMQNYLKQFNLHFVDFIRARYLNGQRIPAELMAGIGADDHRVRYRGGHEISDEAARYLTDKDYRTRYKLGHEIPADMMSVIRTEDYRERYRDGHEIPVDKMALIKDHDYRHRYKFGHDIPDDKMHLVCDDDYSYRYGDGHEIPDDKKYILRDHVYQYRYEQGFEIPENELSIMFSLPSPDNYTSRTEAQRKIIARRYMKSGDISPNHIGLLCDADFSYRYLCGYEIPADKLHYVTDQSLYERICKGYDPECRPYRISYLLGYEVPPRVKLELTARDHEVHQNLELNMKCILALAADPTADLDAIIARA